MLYSVIVSGCEKDDNDIYVQNEVDIELPELRLKNSEVLANLGENLSHLPVIERDSLDNLILVPVQGLQCNSRARCQM